MQAHRTLFLALTLGYPGLALSQAQAPPPDSVSSDDISVAEGLQLPTYGHVWALDTWKGMRELVRLRPPDTTDEPGFSLKLRRTIEFKGEAALVRMHDTAPLFFLRGVSGGDSSDARSDLAIIRLTVTGQRRSATKDAMAQLKLQGKQQDSQSPDVIGLKQQRLGTTLQPRLCHRRAFRFRCGPASTGKLRSSPLRTVPRLLDRSPWREVHAQVSKARPGAPRTS